MAFTCAWPNKYPGSLRFAGRGFAPSRMTSMKDQLKGFKLATREVFEWKSKDGTPIEGILIKPADFEPTKKYPLAGGDPRRPDRRRSSFAFAGIALIRWKCSPPRAR